MSEIAYRTTSWNQSFEEVISEGLTKRHKHKRDCCPNCFRPYKLIDNELIQSCLCPVNSVYDNLCSQCGQQNCRGH